jgi:hypothetical protein
VNSSFADVADTRAFAVTVTSTVPAPAGENTSSWVSLSTVKDAFVPPKLTAVVAEKPEPEIKTSVPPAAGPEDGDTPVTTGGATACAEAAPKPRVNNEAAAKRAAKRVSSGRRDDSRGVCVIESTISQGRERAVEECGTPRDRQNPAPFPTEY